MIAPLVRPAPRGPAPGRGSGLKAEDDLTPAQQRRIERQRQAFNVAAAEHAELLREAGIRQELATAQRKHEDEFLKALIRLI